MEPPRWQRLDASAPDQKPDPSASVQPTDPPEKASDGGEHEVVPQATHDDGPANVAAASVPTDTAVTSPAAQGSQEGTPAMASTQPGPASGSSSEPSSQSAAPANDTAAPVNPAGVTPPQPTQAEDAKAEAESEKEAAAEAKAEVEVPGESPAAPGPVQPEVVPHVPWTTRIREYIGHAYNHDGTSDSAHHAYVVSWLVAISLVLLVLEGAPEFKTFVPADMPSPTATAEPTATPDVVASIRQVVQEEISRNRTLPTTVSELPTVTPQPTPEPSPTPTDAEAAAAKAITREPWFTFPEEAKGIPHTIFVVLEGVVAFLFAIDYVLNAVYQKRSRDYLLGIWGIIDLIAILPFFIVLANYVGFLGEGELPQWVVFIQGLRILRAIKLFRVVSDTRTENALGEVIEGNTFHRDILFGLLAVFSTVAIMEIFGWTNDRHLFWIYIGILSAVTVAIRRWLMHSERGGLSALLVVVSLLTGTAMAVTQDRLGDAPVGELTALYTVIFVTASWLQIEAKDGAL